MTDLSSAPDWEKLRALAQWLDVHDNKRGFTGVRAVQSDLRRIAKALEEDLTDRPKFLEGGPDESP